MTGKKIGIMAGVGAALFLTGLLIGYATFNDNAEVRRLSQELKDEKDAREKERTDATSAHEESVKDKVAEIERLSSELASAKEGAETTIADLKRKLDGTQFDLNNFKERSDKEIVSLNRQLVALKRKEASGPDIPKLVNSLVLTWPSWTRMALAAKDLAAEVEAARFRAPDKEAIDTKAEGLKKASLAYQQGSTSIYHHVQSRRNELRDAGFDCASLEKTFSPRSRKLAEELATEVQAVKESIASQTVNVDSTKAFTDTRIKVEKGDLVFISVPDPRKSTWQMSPEWGERSTAGWEQVPGHLKVTSKLRGGALIIRIGVSNVYLPGYGTMPIIATEDGRLRLGINDKKLDDNLGSIKISLVRVSSSVLDRFTRFWKDAAGRILR